MPTPAIDRIGPTREPGRWPVMRQKLAGAAVPALADPARGAAPARPAATGARPLRRDGLRRPGPVHHDGRPARRPAASPRLIQLPRDERAHLRPPRRPRPRRLVLQPRRGQPGRRRPGPEPGTTFLIITRGCSWSARPRPAPTIPVRSSTRASAAGPIPAPLPTSSAPRPTGPVRPGPARNARTFPRRTVHPLRPCERSALPGPGAPSPLSRCNRRRSSRSTSRSSRPPTSAGPVDPSAHFARGVDVKVYAIQSATLTSPRSPFHSPALPECPLHHSRFVLSDFPFTPPRIAWDRARSSSSTRSRSSNFPIRASTVSPGRPRIHEKTC